LGVIFLKKLYTAYYHEEEPLTKNTFFVVLKLLRRNLFGLVLSFNIFSLLAFNGFPFKSYALFFSFILVWFGYRFALGLARLALLETVRDVGGQDVSLYHKIKWIYSIGAILVALLLAARQLPVDYSVNDFINRLFMLQLLLVSGLLLRSWKVFPVLLNPYFSNRQIYFGRAIRWLSLLIPLALLVNAIVGLIGYVQLAWTMSAYQGMFLLVLLGYLFIRSLLIDLMEWISKRFVLDLPNGWLWSEAFLKPLDKILRLCLFVLAGAFLFFYIYGLDQNSYLANIIKITVSYPVIKLPKDQSINLLNIFGAIIIILVLAWIARWSREFSYRWLYAYQKDLGVRNSLAVFTQYITVIISVYIALELSGKDFTGLNYILGGVSLGAGFGLRDLVNNFASGVLLLIERPVKKGDIVTIGAYEGEVTHIGMRAMTIRTWDHMEVLVPNSETFSKSFTNWTHEDMIIRTVVSIKIQRQDNPYQVKSIIVEALQAVPDVLAEPLSSIYMKELSEPLIQFEVRYFINIQLAGSRSRVRSDVLYAIWDAFKTHNIHPPIPPQDMQVEVLNFAAISREQPNP
jgi:potassium efflux system protein